MRALLIAAMLMSGAARAAWIAPPAHNYGPTPTPVPHIDLLAPLLIDDPQPVGRHYTVEEILRMRRAIRKICCDMINFADFLVEMQLRTYMTAGVAPEELEARAR